MPKGKGAKLSEGQLAVLAKGRAKGLEAMMKIKGGTVSVAKPKAVRRTFDSISNAEWIAAAKAAAEAGMTEAPEQKLEWGWYRNLERITNGFYLLLNTHLPMRRDKNVPAGAISLKALEWIKDHLNLADCQVEKCTTAGQVDPRDIEEPFAESA